MSSESVNNIKSVTIVTPITESQCRPLSKLEPDQQREAWQKAVETAPAGKVTAAVVSKVVNTPPCVPAIAGKDRPPGAVRP
jgi:hypothetical protein